MNDDQNSILIEEFKVAKSDMKIRDQILYEYDEKITPHHQSLRKVSIREKYNVREMATTINDNTISMDDSNFHRWAPNATREF